MAPIGKTLYGGVFAAVNYREGGKQQTVIKMTLQEEARADVLGRRGNHERRRISDAGGPHENGETRMPRVALHEQPASADAQTGAVKRIAEISITRGDIQAMKLERVGRSKNKMTVSESGGSTEGALRKEGCDFASCSAEQGAAPSGKLKNLSAGGNAK